MRIKNRSSRAQSFAKEWAGSDYKEKGNVGKFWIELLEQVFGVDNGAKAINREISVPNMKDSTDYIDAYIPSTRVLIEQKAPYISLDKKEKRSFGMVTPFEQAKHYDDNLPLSKKAKWIITCNFHQFNIYDMNQSGTHPKPTIVYLKDLWQYYYQLDFLIDPTRQDVKQETKLSNTACNLISKIYHKLLLQSDKPNDPQTLKDVNKLSVRLVFCFYADDSDIFGSHGMFRNYMKTIPSYLWSGELKRLNIIMNTPENERHNDQLNKYEAQFPYVNGGMFADKPGEQVGIPNFTEEIKDDVLDAGKNFDWSKISPTIFGSMFETTLNPEERHTNGMHYTSVQNIHKVIDPLFLNNLRHELNHIKIQYKTANAIRSHAKTFQNKLASLTFLDPACGSGNFLTETYLCLRKLENEAIKLQISSVNGVVQGQATMELGQHLIKVSIHQFYGIEINDFAVSVAKTAMWIAESQMAKATEGIVEQHIDFLPLKSNSNIIEANALEMKWSDLINPQNLNYIISNPPFVGQYKNKKQRSDMKNVLKGFNDIGKLDLVSAWYKKSADMTNKNYCIQIALVSTNSITKGEQVGSLWKPLINNNKIHINIAYHPFKWSNNAKNNALVYCVIIEFSKLNKRNKILFLKNGNPVKVTNINPYLHNLPDILVQNRSTPISKVPLLKRGSQPTDRGQLSRYSSRVVDRYVKYYPSSRVLFKPFVGASELIKGHKRFCLWLYNVNPKIWLRIPPIKRAISKVKKFRMNSKNSSTRKSAKTPYLFQHDRQPDSDYLMVPRHTSKNRDYIPLGYFSKNVIAADACYYIPNATPYMFGILESCLHTQWVALVSGRFGPSFRYSAKITYNNFPWPNVTTTQKYKISQTAKGILNVRTNHKNESLADLYNPLAMPPDLQEAHRANDRAVLKAYGLKANASKNEILTKLLKMYAKLTKESK